MKKDKYGCKHDDGHYSKMTGNDRNVSYSIYDKRPDTKGHSSTHINYNTETGKGSIVEHGSSGGSTSTDISCYLTTACMNYYLNNFDDNCYELFVLRWFRDNFVSIEDIKHYYKTAPMIVEAIEQDEYKEIVYNYIYDNVILSCIEAIESGDYNFAYDRYKESILCLENSYLKPALQQNLIKVLKKKLLKFRI